MAFDGSPEGEGASAPSLAALAPLLASWTLSIAALRVLVLLHQLAGRGRFDFATGDLADELGRDRSVVRKSLTALEEAGHVDLDNETRADGSSGRRRFALRGPAAQGMPTPPGKTCAGGVQYLPPLTNKQTPAAGGFAEEGEGDEPEPPRIVADFEPSEAQLEAVQAISPRLDPAAELDAWRDWWASRPECWPPDGHPWTSWQGWCRNAARYAKNWHDRNPDAQRARRATSAAPGADAPKIDPPKLDELAAQVMPGSARPERVARALEAAAGRVGAGAWRSYLATGAVQLDGDVLTLSLKTGFSANLVRARHEPAIAAAVREELGQGVRLEVTGPG